MNSDDRAGVLARFWAKVNKAGPAHPTLGTPCWLWTACLVRSGYGTFWANGMMLRAHRAAFVFSGGAIPAGFQLDHLCRVHHCVNPAHLEVVTARENTMRGVGPTAVNAAATHCSQGHSFDAGNTYRWGGSRQCRECKRIRDHARHVRLRGVSA